MLPSSGSPNQNEQFITALVEARRLIVSILIRLGAGQDAEDIYQQVFETIQSNPARYQRNRHTSEWTGYFVNAARNRFRDHIRNNRRLISGDSGPGQSIFDTLPARESRPSYTNAADLNTEALRCYAELCAGPGGRLAEFVWEELAPRYDCTTAFERLDFLTAFVELKMKRRFPAQRKQIALEVPYHLLRQNGSLKRHLREDLRPRWIARHRQGGNPNKD